ncbi:AI-2E family transporter [Paenibacillus xerothermodurans]|uniref:AI-2E family transporter n=1 Tax=Paenibacillus xerothermodurans TaxID=1977292 RepID=A0A2W1NS73_PAEXE|nr:AI-2E family transporter [Paenibacillus xerothermodurans]PZE20606.1 AI-2E family transporter [Paenibacillus xerothermodurans]
MESSINRAERFRRLFLNNKFVVLLLILLLIGLNILVFNEIPFVFTPLVILLQTVFLPVLLTGVVFYLLDPIVDWFQRRGVKRVYSILLLYLLILGILAAVISIIIPLIREQIMSLAHNFPRYSEQARERFEELTGSRLFTEIQHLAGADADEWTNAITERISAIINRAGANISGLLAAIRNAILAMVTVPFILFYLLKDGDKLPPYILGFIPTGLREQSHAVMVEMNRQISYYIRGQIIVSFCIGILLYIGYRIIGLEYALVLAIIAAFTSVVPFLGPVIAITPALIVAIVTSPAMLLNVIVVWTVVQLIEGKFISPQIMGKSLHIHPITIIFVILTAGNLFGIGGVILAVPAYAVGKVIVTHIFDWFKVRSGLYDPHDQTKT